VGEDVSSDSGQETGGELRAKLEAALDENKNLKSSVSSLTAEKVIRDSNLTYVKPEDLSGLSTDEMVAKATELEASKAAQAEELAAKFLAAKGVTLDQIDGAAAGQKPAETATRVASLGSLPGTRPKPDFEGLHGADLLYAAYNAD